MAFQAKRRNRRSLVKEGVRLQSPAGVEYGTTEDLSAGGLKVVLDREVPPGTLFDAEFSLRDERGRFLEEVKTLVRSVRSVKTQSGHYSVGLQFMDLQDKSRQLIQTLIDDQGGPF